MGKCRRFINHEQLTRPLYISGPRSMYVYIHGDSCFRYTDSCFHGSEVLNCANKTQESVVSVADLQNLFE